MTKKPKHPRDPNKLAKSILDKVIGESEPDTRNPHAVALSKLGSSKGGKARAKSLTSKQRSEIASKAAKKRWDK